MKRKLLSALICFLILFSLPLSAINAYDRLLYGIDVSVFQGNIDWQTLANANLDFCIVRAGTTSINNWNYSDDSKFESNYAGAKSIGINVGAYFYCGASTAEQFQSNARSFLSTIEGKTFEYPVYIDLERSTNQMSLGKDTLTTYALSALEIIRDAGYRCGIYANLDWLRNYIDSSRIENSGYEIWLAQYPSGDYAVDPSGYDKSATCGIWQYSSLGQIGGIGSKYVDLDVCYRDYTDNTLADEECGIDFPRPTVNLRLTSPMTYGSDVRWLQTALQKLGYTVEMDGYFGPDTEAAVKQYQGDYALEADGIFGPASLAKMVELLLPAKHGDADGDGEVTFKDSTCIARFVIGGYGVTLDEELAEVDVDGEVTLRDAALIKRYLAGGYGVEL